MILFNEKKHEYTVNDEVYKSTSKWIEGFTKPFNKEFIAGRVAKRDNVELGFVLDMWALKNSFAIDYGNAVDKAIEYYIKFNELPTHKHLLVVVEAFKKLYDREKLVAQMVVYDKKIKVAGTTDVLEKLGNKEVNIIDVKSNGAFRKVGYNKFLPPFNYMKDGSLNKAKLQLSMYEYLAECNGLTVKEKKILWWTGEEFDVIKVDSVDISEAIKVGNI